MPRCKFVNAGSFTPTSIRRLERFEQLRTMPDEDEELVRLQNQKEINYEMTFDVALRRKNTDPRYRIPLKGQKTKKKKLTGGLEDNPKFSTLMIKTTDIS